VRENSQPSQEIQLSNVNNNGRNGRSGRCGRGGRGRGRFVCFKCGKAGHTASHCISNQTTAQNNSNNGNVRHCNYCGRDGHLENICWLKPGNRVPGRAVRGLQDELRELRASTVTRNSGRANTNESVLSSIDVQQGTTEYCLTIIEEDKLQFPRSMNLLHDADIWIADSGCSMHCTGHKNGMENVVEHSKNTGDGYVQPDGTENKIISTGDLPVVLHSKYGMPVGNCRFLGVNYGPGQRFNLFSTTKLQLDGWIPGGDTEALWFTRPKTDLVVKFDIKIETGRGCVFAACFRRSSDQQEELSMTNIRNGYFASSPTFGSHE
jgi:hypothetical protein